MVAHHVTVIGREENQGLLIVPSFLHGLEDSSDLLVHMGNTCQVRLAGGPDLIVREMASCRTRSILQGSREVTELPPRPLTDLRHWKLDSAVVIEPALRRIKRWMGSLE